MHQYVKEIYEELEVVEDPWKMLYLNELLSEYGPALEKEVAPGTPISLEDVKNFAHDWETYGMFQDK